MKCLLIPLAAIALGCGSAPGPAPETASKPNIVIMATGDLGVTGAPAPAPFEL